MNQNPEPEIENKASFAKAIKAAMAADPEIVQIGEGGKRVKHDGSRISSNPDLLREILRQLEILAPRFKRE